MACVALTSLISTIEIEFLQPTPRIRLSLHHRLLITSILENLSSLQAFLQKESSGDGDGDAVRDLEIEIRDFALKAEDDIEIQLSNTLLSELEDRREYGEKEAASHEHELLLHQTLEEAAKNTTELLESCVSEREMASVALTILIKKFEHYYLQHFPTVYLANIYFLLKNLYSLQGCLLQEGNSNSNDSGAAIKKLESEIRIFALKAEHDLEIQLSNFLLAKHTQHEEKASQELSQTLREAAKSAEELLNIIEKEKKKHEIEKELTCNALTSLRKTIEKAGIKSNLLENLSSLQVFMQKESNGGGGCGGGGAAMKDLETKIKNFALKAIDDIKDTEYEEKVPQKLHQTMQEAAESAAKLLNIIKSSSRRSNEEVDDDEANETRPLKHAASKSADVDSNGSSHGFLKPEGIMVGRHHDCTVIKDLLFSSFSFIPLRIISIVGMVGIGKTTVARNVYEDPSVASHFDVRSWVTIPPPQHYNKSRMLNELLQSIKPEEPNVIKKGSTPDELQMQVRECLRDRKYLIVLDNIISSQAWTDIKNWFPAVGVGSCILLTTRHLNQYKDLSTHHIHNMTLLDPNESWELFCNILSIEEHLAPNFEKIRNDVVEKCDGLPWLIVEVAKRLSKCNNIQKGWKKIEKELESLGILDRNSLSVGYNMLPSHLKVCFLYFGVFPKRNRILVTMLIRLWIAEGFVMNPLEHMALDDQAYEYLLELIDRSLLLIEDQSFDSKIKTCRMHSAMHSFCVVEAQKEGILCAVNTQQHSGLSLDVFANSCRWLSLYPHSFDYYVLFGTNIPRSMFFFHESPKMFVPLKLLRVLTFDTCIFLQRLPLHVADLVCLRYLSITQWYEGLDEVVSNNLNLQTFVVSCDRAPTVHLPSSIWKPPYLMHLELGNSYIVDPPSMLKENLQSLSCVLRSIHFRMEVYNKFPSIKKLKIFLKDDIEPSHTGGSCCNPIILDSFVCLEVLEKLSISVSIGCNVALPGYYIYPSGLKKLKLSGANISERDLTEIGKLHYLTVLKLENAFHGTVWKVAEGAFPALIFLLLEAKNLKQWVVSHKEFPVLRHLVLRSCYCLEQIPKGLARIYTLESIELEGCASSLVASAKQFQRDTGNSFVEIKILGP